MKINRKVNTGSPIFSELPVCLFENMERIIKTNSTLIPKHLDFLIHHVFNPQKRGIQEKYTVTNEERAIFFGIQARAYGLEFCADKAGVVFNPCLYSGYSDLNKYWEEGDSLALKLILQGAIEKKTFWDLPETTYETHHILIKKIGYFLNMSALSSFTRGFILFFNPYQPNRSE
ncbi:MAG: hypothetical protein KAI83_20220 [Thiomargarita sp.]|nr:hypothetical protein [Thiomargarita sp.]